MKDTAVCFDRNTGKPYGELIVDKDRRVYREYLKFIADQEKDKLRDLREKTGMQLNYTFSVVKILYLIRQNADIQREMQNYSDIIFGTLDSFILYRLTGQLYTSASMAATTYMVDIANNPYVWSNYLLEFFKIKSKWLPYIRPTAFQFGRIDLNINTSGFYKKTNDSKYFKEIKEKVSNIYITDYLLDKNYTNEYDRVNHLKAKDDDVYEKVEAVKNFSEDIPNMFISNYKCSQNFNKRTNLNVTKMEELKLHNKVRNMNMFVDVVSYPGCFSMVGHNCIHNRGDTMIQFHDEFIIYTFLDTNFHLSDNLQIDTNICYDYIKIDEEKNNQYKVQTYLSNLYQKDNTGYPLYEFYTKPFAHRNYWKVYYMHTVRLKCDKTFESIISTLNIGKYPREVSEYLNLVSFEQKNKLIYVNRFNRDFYHNINISHNLYHLSKAMLESITFETYIWLENIMNEVEIDLYKYHEKLPEYKIAVDGKYSKCDSLMKELSEILNFKLHYYNNYTQDYTSQLVGMVILQTSISTRNPPPKLINNIYNILKTNIFSPSEVSLSQAELSKLDNDEQIREFATNKKLNINNDKIDEFKAVVNTYYYKTFNYTKKYMKDFIETLEEQKEKSPYEIIENKMNKKIELTVSDKVEEALETNIKKSMMRSAIKLGGKFNKLQTKNLESTSYRKHMTLSQGNTNSYKSLEKVSREDADKSNNTPKKDNINYDKTDSLSRNNTYNMLDDDNDNYNKTARSLRSLGSLKNFD